jgi:O-antigen ligase
MRTQAPLAQASYPPPAPAPRKRRRWLRFGAGLAWIPGFAIPWGDMIQLPYDIQASRVVTVVVFLGWLLSLLGSRRLRRPDGIQILMLLFAALAGISGLWSVEVELSVRRALSYTQLFLIVCVVYHSVQNEEDYRTMLSAYVLGAYVGLAGLAYSYFNGVVSGDGRYSAPGFDPNDLAVTLALGIPMACYLELTSGRRQWLFYLYTPLTIGAVMLTASRGGAVAVGASLMFLVFIWRGLPRRRKFKYVGLGLVCGTLLFLMWTNLSVRRLATFVEQVSSRDLNGRVDVWEVAVAAFQANPVFGVGSGSFSTAVGGSRGMSRAVHNTFLGVLVEQGLVGLAILLMILLGLWKKAWRAPPLESRLWLVLLFTWTLGASSLSWENRETTWLIWALCLSQPSEWGWRMRRKIVASARNPSPSFQIRNGVQCGSVGGA